LPRDAAWIVERFSLHSPGPCIRSYSRSYPRRTPPHTRRMAAHHCYSSGGRASTNGTSHGPTDDDGACQS
jgi:hypothetical protein